MNTPAAEVRKFLITAAHVVEWFAVTPENENVAIGRTFHPDNTTADFSVSTYCNKTAVALQKCVVLYTIPGTKSGYISVEDTREMGEKLAGFWVQDHFSDAFIYTADGKYGRISPTDIILAAMVNAAMAPGASDVVH